MKLALSTILSLALAAPVAAQTADGWDVRADPASGVTVAGAAFDSGLAIIFRCQANSLDAIMTGLPAGDPGGRRLELSFAGAEFEPQGWINAEATTAAYSQRPARLARLARRGNGLAVRVPATDWDTAHVYQMALPTDSAGLDTVLAACGVPTDDPRDRQPAYVRNDADPLGWTRQPVPTFPQGAQEQGILSGRVTLSCVIGADAKPQDCRVEMQSPAGLGFARAALDAAATAAFDLPDDPASAVGRLITFQVAFRAPR
jgi:hypothetical protein